jgi:photosystem II stability/assembly factor-like uncharacterized protein
MQLKRFTFFLFTAIIFLQCMHQDKKRIISSNEEMDGIDQAMRQEFFQTRDPLLNVIPNERLEVARAYMQTLLPGGGNARTMALAWQERGPNNIGGRSRAIMIDKRDGTGNTIFAASISGGIFKTTNFTSASATWTVVNDQMANLAVSVLLQDKNNFNTMYAGTGEGWFNIGAVRGAGIFKSTDGGTTWNQMPSTANFEYVQDLLIDNNGNLYAALRNLTSTNRGVMRSTDGGTTWTQVLGLPLTDFAYTTGRAADLELASNGDIYATLGIFTRTMVMKSSFAINGANTGGPGAWTEITPVHSEITTRGEIAVAPSNPQRVYLMMHDSLTDQVLTFYRSNDGGANWTPLTAPDALNNGSNSQTWYDLISAVDSTNADVVVVGGLQLAKTTDGGTSWNTISSSPNVHVDQHALVFFNSSRLLIGNDGGIYYSADISTPNPNFTQKDNGFSATQFYACDYHPTDANYFLAGAQDNNTQKFTLPGINSTTPVIGGDGGMPHIRQTDGVLQIAATTGNNYFRSLNSGASFSSLGSGINNNRGQFINPTDLENAQNILYAGDDMGKYYCISNLNATPSGSVKTVPEMGTDRGVTAIKVDPSAVNTIWIGASTVDESQSALRPLVLKIVSANTTPSVQVNSILPVAIPAGAEISSIDIDPANTDNILVTISNYGVPSVWLSINGGATWSNIEGNLPDMPVHSGIFAPSNAQLNGATGGNGGIILATDLGVWTTSQINGTSTQWIPNNSGFPNVSTYMLKYRASDNLLAAATHGRGLFTTTIPTVVTGVPNITITKDFIKYISADNGQLQIVVGTLSVKDMTIQLYDMKDQYQNSVINIGRLQTGSYIVKITGDKKENFVQQFIKK